MMRRAIAHIPWRMRSCFSDSFARGCLHRNRCGGLRPRRPTSGEDTGRYSSIRSAIGATPVAVVLWSAVMAAGPVLAGDVTLRYSSQEVFAGVPFTVAIDVESDKSHDPPEFPKLDNATVESAGQQSSSRSSFQITINGRQITNSSSTRYLYRITPKNEGQLIIPPIDIDVDGQTLRTPRRVFTVKKAETGDLLFVEVTASKDSIYVGEPVDLTMKIWLRPFSDRQVDLNHNQMWERIDAALSDWGPFEDLVLTRRPNVSVTQEPRAGADGRTYRYFVYELKKQVWPERSGPLDLGDLRVVVDYPLRIERDNSFFFNNLKITQSKTIVGVIEESPVTVKPVPTEGRPAYYSGAVGRHRISTDVSPTKARVGDPLTLNIRVAGVGEMNLLQPPPIADLPAFAGTFQVDDDRLPGMVNGRIKTFTISIRALSPDVEEIPAIPFAYFDPDSGKFVTVHSDAIPISISAAEKMNIAQIVESRTEGDGGVDSLTRLESGIEGNYADPDLVLAQQGFNPGPGTIAMAAAPPVVWMLCWAGVWVRRRRMSDVALVRRRQAKGQAIAKVQRACQQSTPTESAALLGSALLGYVADRFDLPAGGLTRAEAVEQLRARQVDDPQTNNGLADRVDAVLADCEAVQFAGMTGGADNLAGRVEACVQELEATRF